MSDFNVLNSAVQKRFKQMSEGNLFVTDISKDDMWALYLSSFPEGSNPMYKERTEHDCNCCKQFIRAAGNVVSIVDNKLVSIWDIKIGGDYQVVADALAKKVKAKKIRDVFLSDVKKVGTVSNIQLTEAGQTIKWEHFSLVLPSKVVMSKDNIGSKLGDLRSNKEVFQRGLAEITLEAAETVLELIEQKSLARGDEHKSVVELFLKHKKVFDKLKTKAKKDFYSWDRSMMLGGVARIRNTVIGTLLVDISDGVELDKAVGSFEKKVAGENYKRPTALVSKKMIEQAQATVAEQGLEPSFHRRHSTIDDLTINNVRWANRDAKEAMSLFGELIKDTPTPLKTLQKVEEIDIEDFINTILPKADSLELLVENSHINNFVSLISPVYTDALPIFKWDNNFSWAYNGEVADSMKERVKKAGGDIEGVLRFSIQWNENGDNQIDFDAHCIEPNSNQIYYGNKGRRHPSSAMLDVDIVSPGTKVAVENITWADKARIQQGRHQMIVHNYSSRTSKAGFTAEIEYEGKIYTYAYNKTLKPKQKVVVADFDFNRVSGITFNKSLPAEETAKEVWNIKTHSFHKVDVVMNSPNHWDGNETGNKHYFFMLDSCKNDEPARGFFNEFLKGDLTKHRKVFEVLGSKLRVEPSDSQLSGLGFSSTQRNHVFCKVVGTFTRTIKINF